jgi:hypothetical protein
VISGRIASRWRCPARGGKEKEIFTNLVEEVLSPQSSAPAAFSVKSSPSRMYLASMASDAWPVCWRIFHDDTPAWAALVASPARRLWPE